MESYFYKKQGVEISLDETTHTTDWDNCIQKLSDRMQTIDVRNLEMPKPMLTILDTLDHLTSDTALFVYHKRIPVFLLPELKERKFDYRIKEISDDEVHLLIFKD